MLEFTVIDTTTNEYPDLWKIATTEEWAKHLMYCDMEGFAISEDGALLLLDECGNVAYCPADRFKVVYTVDVTPVIAEERADVAKEVLLELERQIHDKAIYPGAKDAYSFVNVKVFDAVLNNLLKKYEVDKK